MRDYRTVNMVGAGDFIASVSGSGTDFDIVTDYGFTLEEYNPDASGLLNGADPVAGDLLVFGARNGQRAATVANADVIPAAVAAIYFKPGDST
jgi:hypothetical protein